MIKKTSLLGLTLVSLSTLLLFGLSSADSIAEQSHASPQGDSFRGEEPRNRRDAVTSNGESVMTLFAKAPTAPQPTTCPAQTLRVGGECVLTRDITLNETLILPAYTTLDCRGHKISGRLPADRTQNSTPQTAIFLNSVQGVVIKGCEIDRVDFGVFAINSKLLRPLLSLMLINSKINARYTGVSLMGVDSAQIVYNSITYTRGAGKAVYIGRDSDWNLVSKNTVIADIPVGECPPEMRCTLPAYRAPGPKSSGNLLVERKGAAVVIAQIEGGGRPSATNPNQGPEPALQNIIVGGKLFQITVPYTLTATWSNGVSSFSEGNRVEGNTLRFNGQSVDGIVLAAPLSTQVLGNKIEGGAEAAIRTGAQPLIDRNFPGKCKSSIAAGVVSLSAERLCLNKDDCNIEGFDRVGQGECIGVTTQVINWTAYDSRIEANTIAGPFADGIITNGNNTIINRNTIVGPQRNGEPMGTAIKLAGTFAMDSTTVTRNSVSNVAVALDLIQVYAVPGGGPLEATRFLTQVSQNDFTGYTTAVLTSRTSSLTSPGLSDLLTELSVAGRGNFWGTPSCTGLRAADVTHFNGGPNGLVTDKHPYRMPVAKSLVAVPCGSVVQP